MRLKPSGLNRLQRRRLLLRVASHYGGTQTDFTHLQSFYLFQSLTDSPDTFGGLHPLDLDPHNSS